MTTFEPGASEVFTHGWRVSPRATALRASRPAPSITEGLEVFVHDVIAAMTTCPWSSANVSPSRVTDTASDGRSATAAPAPWATAGSGCGSRAPSPLTGSVVEGGSLAGKDSDEP